MAKRNKTTYRKGQRVWVNGSDGVRAQYGHILGRKNGGYVVELSNGDADLVDPSLLRKNKPTRKRNPGASTRKKNPATHELCGEVHALWQPYEGEQAIARDPATRKTVTGVIARVRELMDSHGNQVFEGRSQAWEYLVVDRETGDQIWAVRANMFPVNLSAAHFRHQNPSWTPYRKPGEKVWVGGKGGQYGYIRGSKGGDYIVELYDGRTVLAAPSLVKAPPKKLAKTSTRKKKPEPPRNARPREQELLAAWQPRLGETVFVYNPHPLSQQVEPGRIIDFRTYYDQNDKTHIDPVTGDFVQEYRVEFDQQRRGKAISVYVLKEDMFPLDMTTTRRKLSGRRKNPKTWEEEFAAWRPAHGDKVMAINRHPLSGQIEEGTIVQSWVYKDRNGKAHIDPVTEDLYREYRVEFDKKRGPNTHIGDYLKGEMIPIHLYGISTRQENPYGYLEHSLSHPHHPEGMEVQYTFREPSQASVLSFATGESIIYSGGYKMITTSGETAYLGKDLSAALKTLNLTKSEFNKVKDKIASGQSRAKAKLSSGKKPKGSVEKQIQAEKLRQEKAKTDKLEAQATKAEAEAVQAIQRTGSPASTDFESAFLANLDAGLASIGKG